MSNSEYHNVSYMQLTDTEKIFTVFPFKVRLEGLKFHHEEMPHLQSELDVHDVHVTSMTITFTT